jgi:hypothetical protein
MNISPLRKLLKDKPDLNPFNDKFQKESYLEIIFQTLSYEQVVNDDLSELLKILPFLNNNFKEYYSYIKENIDNSNVSYEKLVDLIFTIFNRNFLIVTKQMLAEGQKDKILNQKRAFSYKVQTLDDSIGKVEAAAALESDMDALMYVINFVRYFEHDEITIDQNKQDVHPIEISQRISLSSNYFNILKNIYDESIWNFGFWKLDESNSKPKIHVIFKNTEVLILNKVGLLRLQRNISSNFFFAQNELDKNTLYGKFISDAIKSNCKEKRIKRVTINNGFINYQLAKGFGKKEILAELKNTSAYITYYTFLENLRFELFYNLSLSDLLKLYSNLQALVQEAELIDFDDSIFSIDDIKRFPNKITHEGLLNYFLERTTYSRAQISKFLDLVSFKFGDRVNLWDRPLVRYKSSYYINFLPTLSPIVLNLMDHWIEMGGYDLDIRGKYLEKYLQQEIRAVLSIKKFYSQILEKNKLYNKAKKFEELDLVIILKSVVVVAEVKCIKYPYEARDKHNSFKRLKQGVKQIKRKKEFIEKYKSEIPELLGHVGDKKLIPIVITNFPMYSGCIVDGVPITDFYLFESFFEAGKMTDERIQRGGRGEILKETFYYRNEDEMNSNLESFFHNPYPIEELKSLFQIVDQKISLKAFDYDLYVTSAQIPDSYNPDVGIAD